MLWQIYPSEYGLKRMEEENVHGPRIQTGSSELHGDEVEDKQGEVYCIMCGSACVKYCHDGAWCQSYGAWWL